MNRKTFLIMLLVTGIVAFVAWKAGRQSSVESTTSKDGADVVRKVRFYQSPMHPWVTSEQPGNCTVCGMKLVAIYEGEQSMEKDDGKFVRLNARSINVVGVDSVPVSREVVRHELRVSGTFEDDTVRHKIVSSWFEGRIEKLFINYIGAEIKKGEPIATYSSRELVTAQQDFLQIMNGGQATVSVIEGARERLLRLGFTGEQINQLAQDKQLQWSVTTYSPVSGTVVARTAYEGMVVMNGTPLFEIGDFDSLWFLCDVYEQDLPLIKVGQKVRITTASAPGQVFEAPIDFIDPNINAKTQTAQIRVVVKNPLFGEGPTARRLLLHRVYGEGKIQVESDPVLAIPRSAILNTGSGAIVYVDKGSGAYEGRKIVLGRKGTVFAEVKEGLKEGEKVVVQGNLLIDAQAQMDAGVVPVQASEVHTVVTSDVKPKQEADLKTFANIVDLSVQASEALAADNYAHYQTLVPLLNEAGKRHGLTGVLAGADIKSARASFEPFSNKVVELVYSEKKYFEVHVFECGMSPVLGKAQWVQKGATARNPFFGAEMLECGVEKEEE